VPVGDTQRGFAAAAQRDGIELVGQSVDRLNRRGHLGLPTDEKRRKRNRALTCEMLGAQCLIQYSLGRRSNFANGVFLIENASRRTTFLILIRDGQPSAAGSGVT
jgi:hypothetical protein